MKPVTVYCKSLKVNLERGPDIRDITPLLEQIIHESQVEDGNLCATMVGSTGSLTTVEFEPGKKPGMTATVTAMCRPRYWVPLSRCRLERGI